MDNKQDGRFRREWFDCICRSIPCSFIITEYLDDDSDLSRLSISTQVETGGFFYRVKTALKYIFTRKSVFLSETLLTKDSSSKLVTFIQKVDWPSEKKQD